MAQLRPPKVWLAPEFTAPWNSAWVASLTGQLSHTPTAEHPEYRAHLIELENEESPPAPDLESALARLRKWLYTDYQPGDVLVCGALDEAIYGGGLAEMGACDPKMHVIAHWHSTPKIPFHSDSAEIKIPLTEITRRFSWVDTWYTANHLLMPDWLPPSGPTFGTGFPYEPFGGRPLTARVNKLDDALARKHITILIAGRPHPTKQLPLAAWLAVDAVRRLRLQEDGYRVRFILSLPETTQEIPSDLSDMLTMLQQRWDFQLVTTAAGYKAAMLESLFYVSATMNEFFPLTPIDALYADAIPLLPNLEIHQRLYSPGNLYEPYSGSSLACVMNAHLHKRAKNAMTYAVRDHHDHIRVQQRFMELAACKMRGMTVDETVERLGLYALSSDPHFFEWPAGKPIWTPGSTLP